MLDRTLPPTLHPMQAVEIPTFTTITLPNGIPLYIINSGEQAVCRLEIMFNAGSFEQSHPLVAHFTNLMLKEGAAGKSSAEIAQKLDYYGAWLQPATTMHNSYITLYSLNKHIDHTFPLLEAMIKCPDFPQKEFAVNKERKIQQFLLSQEKVQPIALREFKKLFYGTNHPYGLSAVKKDFQHLTTDMLRQYHQQYYTAANCKIVVAGKIDDTLISKIALHFGTNNYPQPTLKVENLKYILQPSTAHSIITPKKGALQAALYIGSYIPSRNHPHYTALRMLNTALGGYFGSRLMSNIREEKGYTYGIHSQITAQKECCSLLIQCEADTTQTQPLIAEVKKEIEKLGQTPLSNEEFERVRNYMYGEQSRQFDGAFATADAFIALLANNLPMDYYNTLSQNMAQLTPALLQKVAQEHLKWENFYLSIAGAVS